MPLLKIDGKEFEVESGTTVLQVAKANGIAVSYTHLTLPTICSV